MVCIPSTPEMTAVVDAINAAEGRVIVSFSLGERFKAVMAGIVRERMLLDAAPLVVTPCWAARDDDWTNLDRYRKD